MQRHRVVKTHEAQLPQTNCATMVNDPKNVAMFPAQIHCIFIFWGAFSMLLCEEYEFASFQKNVKVLTIMKCLLTRKLDFLLATIICSRNLDHGVRNNYGRTKASKSLISHTKLSLNAARLKRRSMQINVSWSLHHWNLQTMRLSLYSWQYSLLHCQAYKSDIAINGEFLALYVPLRSFNVIKVGTNQ